MTSLPPSSTAHSLIIAAFFFGLLTGASAMAFLALIMHRLSCESAGIPPRSRARLSPPSPASRTHGVHSAYRDVDGWLLFDHSGDPIENWPRTWPDTVDRRFLQSEGVLIGA